MKVNLDYYPTSCEQCPFDKVKKIAEWCEMGSCIVSMLNNHNILDFTTKKKYTSVRNWTHLKDGDWVQIRVWDGEQHFMLTGLVCNGYIYTNYLESYDFDDPDIFVLAAISQHHSVDLPKDLHEARVFFNCVTLRGNYTIDYIEE